MQEMYLGRDASIKCFVAYIEVTCAGSGINNSAFGRFTSYLEGIDRDQVKEVLDKNQAALSEFAHLHTVKEAAQMMLTGDVIFFVDGYPDAFKLPDKGYPAMSIQEIDSEKVIRGSNEGFADSIKINTALIRRRLRSTRLKCKEVKKGLRGHSNVDILYVRDLVKEGLVEEVERNLDSYVIDHVGDSGVIEQFAEAKWYSPFPQLQTTKRPDVAVNALLEGRVVVLCDNSPIAIILPTTMNNFLKTADDYYNRTIAASFARLIRYVAAFMSFTLPGLYLAVTNFHTQILPTPLILAFYEARLGCPFPQLIEVLMMELSFELLREAGIRLPGAMGNTIGIVGGLIIGQAAVDANLVSPIVVILVAFTALCSFARLIRYVAAFMSFTLPGLYLAVTNFHTQILPTPLILAFYEARLGCPFPQLIEVLMMELSFELLREAGIRLPGAMGNTIGIVGGLIIGQAAVDANLVSPIVVILVAFTALCSFAIPSEEFAFSFRILKFAVIIMSAWLGYFGFLISLMVILLHLAKLKSCGYPYMMPFVGSELTGGEDEKDSIIRFPLRKLWRRPVFAREKECRKLKGNKYD